jgi:hypothetical protein
MDPYLESHNLWPDVHNRLISIFAEQLAPQLAPKYVAELQTQLIIGQLGQDPKGALPDISITRTDSQSFDSQSFDSESDNDEDGDTAVAVKPSKVIMKVPSLVPIELTSIYVRRVEGEELITVIELLSPVNKHQGKERHKYIVKRLSFFDSAIHLVELDLLREGPRMPFEGKVPDCDYLLMVSRSYQRPDCEAWPLSVRDPLPVLPVPVHLPDRDVQLDVGQALRVAYERARYDLRINYSVPPVPRLRTSDAEWARSLIEKI